MNANRLSQPEIFQALKGIVELPESRFKKMLLETNQSGKLVWDELFIQHLIQKLPYFLSQSIIDIAQTLQKSSIKRSYYILSPKAQGLWLAIQKEFSKRSQNFDNDTLLKVIKIMSLARRGSRKFYLDMEQHLIESDIPLDAKHIKTAIQSYARVDMGSGIFYDNMIRNMEKRLTSDFSLIQRVELVSVMSKCTNVHAGCYGLLAQLEEDITDSIKHKKLRFHQIQRIAAIFLSENLGSNHLQNQIEEQLFSLWEHEDDKHNQLMMKFLKQTRGQYYFQCKPLLLAFESKIRKQMTQINKQKQISKIQDIFWIVSASSSPQATYIKTEQNKIELKLTNNTNPFNRQLKYEAINQIVKYLPSMKPRNIAYIATGLSNIYKQQISLCPQYESQQNYSSQVNSMFKSYMVQLDRAVFAKQDKFDLPHDAIRTLKAFVQLRKSFDGFYDTFNILLQKTLQDVKRVKVLDAITFFELFLQNRDMEHFYTQNITNEIWKQFEKQVFLPALPKLQIGELVRLLQLVSQIVLKASGQLSQSDKSNQNQEFLVKLINSVIMKAFDLQQKDFANVAVKLLNLGAIKQFKKALSPIMFDILQSKNQQGAFGFLFLAKEKLYDKKLRVSFDVVDQVMKLTSAIKIIWSVLCVRLIDPQSSVGKKLFLAIDFKQHLQEGIIKQLKLVGFDVLSCEEMIMFGQIIQILKQFKVKRSGGRSKSTQFYDQYLEEQYLQNVQNINQQAALKKWLIQDRLTPKPEAMLVIGDLIQKVIQSIQNANSSQENQKQFNLSKKVSDEFGNQLHFLIERINKKDLVCVNIVPRRIFIGDTYQKHLVQEIRQKFIMQKGIYLIDLVEDKVISQDVQLKQYLEKFENQLRQVLLGE